MTLVTTIVSLLRRGRPHAVVWRIGAIVIQPLKAIAWSWLWTHVSKESGKTPLPTWADRDTASAPVWVARVPCPEAPRFHVAPRFILGSGAPMALALTVLEITLHGCVSSETPTTSRSPRREVTASHISGLPTVTRAGPVMAVTIPPFFVGYHAQASETAADKVG